MTIDKMVIGQDYNWTIRYLGKMAIGQDGNWTRGDNWQDGN